MIGIRGGDLVRSIRSSQPNGLWSALESVGVASYGMLISFDYLSWICYISRYNYDY